MPPILSSIVEICVFKLVHGAPRYLLLKRAADNKIYPGIWQFVSGTRGPEEDAVTAARRELHEETQLNEKRFWVAPFVSSFYDASRDVIQLSPFFAAEVDREEDPVLSSEHQSFEWYDVDEARGKLVWPGQCQGLTIVHDYVVHRQDTAQLIELHNTVK